MRLSAVFAISVFLLLCAGTGGHAAKSPEISASELLENFTSMFDAVPPPPEVTEAAVIELEQDDPQTYIFIRGASLHPPRPVNLGGDGRLVLTRQDTGEQTAAVYRRADGTYDEDGLARLNRLMRCRLTGKEPAVSIKLIEILDAIDDRFGKKGLVLLSGYRTPTLNRQVSGAARRSLHMLGWAADIRVAGRGADKVTAYARKLHAGGVGYYPDAAFTHIDAGRIRHWVQKRPRAIVPAGKPQAPAAAPR